ncbi:hypothetical protein EJ076_02980 [Mesorhizobium sp. M7D.F.Ca.US.005.01.1.1]|uniref:hypothetical protein n=1 Tax=Mesorhizobium sp. M7D.F.Ca.US.005.01.1.1 TaxID=2493678 RepID=UPI000F74F291|nr:hypothetical protein [Mesorhizobium sp. M7D.F.Ca.US.005.01.1.1]AZO40159.1 hypothetical protein EJ076_02980 [Mesorhizobium sp. M7D.F.Ca.US.005.01.1.1]
MTNRKTLFAALAALALLASPALAGAGGNGHGGGNGGGNAGGNGNGGGNAGGNGGGNGSGKSGASHGKSSSAPGRAAKADSTTVDTTTKVSAVPKEKNIHAKLGRLNSLQRNINAYMNSKSKKFAAIQAFVTQSAKAKVAQDQLDALTAQLDALKALTPDEIAALSAEDQAALPGKITDLEAEIATQTTAAEAAAEGTDDASLDAALTDMANKPVDDEVTAWAQGVLADKIDQTAATMQTETTP